MQTDRLTNPEPENWSEEMVADSNIKADMALMNTCIYIGIRAY